MQRLVAGGPVAWYSSGYSGRSWSFPQHCPCLFTPQCPVLPLVCCFGLVFILSYTILLYYFLDFASSSVPISLIFCLFFVLIPVIPLDHQPGSHLLQCHYFLSQPRSLHTKLPICTLPALSGVHGCGGPAEHAPADGNSADLCTARPLTASPHRLPTRLPR